MKFERSNNNVFLSKRKFFDDKNFPYGFHRSGDFTIAEADVLSGCGSTMSQLVSGKLTPSGPEQERFVRVINGREQVQFFEEAVYLKYMQLIQEKEKIFPPVKKVQSTEQVVEVNTDEDEEFI